MNSADIVFAADTRANENGSSTYGCKLLSPRSPIEPVLDQRFQEMSLVKKNDATFEKQKQEPKQSRTIPMKKRSVSFEMDDEGKIKDHVANDSVITLTDNEKQNLWWSAVETAIMAERLRLITLYYHKNKSEYKANFLHLFLRCSRTPKITRAEGTEIIAVDRRGRRSARGLERHINEILSVYRNNYVKTILDIQSKMPSELSPEIRSRLLRATSSNLTKPSRNLARFLAYQDELEVGENILKELHDSGIVTV